MNHFHVSAHHTFSQLICKSPMSSFPFLCSGREPKQRERSLFRLKALRLIHIAHTYSTDEGKLISPKVLFNAEIFFSIHFLKDKVLIITFFCLCHNNRILFIIVH